MRRIWTFFSSVDADRQEYLRLFGSFVPILASIRLLARRNGHCWEDGKRKELAGCFRAGYRLRLPPHIVDAFFNAPGGYRAQYAVSPASGARMNRKLVDFLLSTVLASDQSTKDERVLRSLRGEESKVWIDEDESQVQRHYHDSTPEINFPRWLRNSKDGAGLRAPIGANLVVYGGWIDQRGVEWLDPGKTNRSEEIYECGFS